MTRGKAGRAAVDIVADVAGFGRDLERELDKEIKKVDVDVDHISDQIGDAVKDGVEQAERALGGLDDAARDALGDVGEQARRAGEELGDAIGEGAEDAAAAARRAVAEIDAELESVDKQIDKVNGTLKELAREFARTGDQDIFVKIRGEKATLVNLQRIRAALDEVGDEARETERKLADVADTGSTAVKGFHKVMTDTVTSMVGLGMSAAGFLANLSNPTGWIAAAAGIALVGSALPILIGVGAALADLVGLVVAAPAAISVLAATMIPLQMAFSGFGEAISAIMDGDPEKITEALEGMAPAARSVLKEFQSLWPTLEKLGDAVQNAFFTPLKGKLTEIADVILPTVSGGFKKIGKELGEFSREILDMVKAPQAVSFMNKVFDTTARIFDRAGPAAQALIDIFITFGDTALPLIEDFAGWLMDGAENLGVLVDNAKKSGALQDFLDDAVATAKDLWGLFKAVGKLFMAVFSDGDDAGRSFIQTITDAVNRLAEFMDSGEGQKVIDRIVDSIPKVASAVQSIVDAIIWVVEAGNDLEEFFTDIGDAASATGDFFSDLGTTISDAFSDAWNAVSEFFSDVGDWFAGIPDWFSDMGSSIGDAFSDAWDAVVEFFEGLGQWFSELPGRIGEWLSAFGQALVDGLAQAFEWALIGIGVAIGLLLFAILELPGLIWDGLVALPGILGEFFTNLWNSVTEITMSLLTAAIAWLLTVPGQISDALSSLWETMSTFFSNVWTSVRDTTVRWFNSTVEWIAGVPGRVWTALQALPGRAAAIWNSTVSSVRSIAISGFNAVISWITSVPGKIAGLAGRFVDAGGKLIQGLLSGLRRVGNWAGDVGGAIVSSIRGGLNSMIGSINYGISRVDDVLPGSLPRIPFLAKGGMTMGPTIAALSEYGQQEVVLPIEDARTMAALRDALGGAGGGTQIVFAAGAISVSFSGVVPSEEEAYRTGQAVGRGVANTLARSDVATTIRTI